jgi:hypothetical protein
MSKYADIFNSVECECLDLITWLRAELKADFEAGTVEEDLFYKIDNSLSNDHRTIIDRATARQKEVDDSQKPGLTKKQQKSLAHRIQKGKETDAFILRLRDMMIRKKIEKDSPTLN